MDLLKRLRAFRSDRILRWVKPAKNHYMVIVWRRVNPRYDMSAGVGAGVDKDFDGINDFQFISVDYTRTRLGAILVQLIHGRSHWSDGFRQQRVEIFPPDYGRVIFRDVLAPVVSPFDFDGYPDVPGYNDSGDDK